MIYVVSDLHGQYELFRRLLKKIEFAQDDVLFVLGDCVDRGPMSIQILKEMKDSANIELLIGNHECMMLRALNPDGSIRDMEDFSLWANYNGGDITHRQFLELPEAERAELYNWLLTRKLTTILEMGGQKYYLTHALPDERFIDFAIKDVPIEDVWKIVWNSPYRDNDGTKCSFLDYPQDGITVMGHVPVVRCHHKDLSPHEQMNTTNIDGGCSMEGWSETQYTGVLILRLDDMKSFGYSFSDLTDNLLEENATDQQIIDALGVYVAAPIINMRSNYSKFIN